MRSLFVALGVYPGLGGMQRHNHRPQVFLSEPVPSQGL
jgi:hypothetical protein